MPSSTCTARTSWQGTSSSAPANNVFDREYTTGGLLGENAFPGGTFETDPEEWRKTTFYAPGMPRTFWSACEMRF
jgi:iron complex outermembrane recepter protein